MGQGRGGHQYFDDELGALAGVVVSRVHPNRADRESIEDCFQTAYVAGLVAKQTALRSQRRISTHILMMAMQRDVYRLLHRANRGALRESDLQICA